MALDPNLIESVAKVFRESIAYKTGESWDEIDPHIRAIYREHVRIILNAVGYEQILAEMLRYLPVIERAEADIDIWHRITVGTGIATANGYRAALSPEQDVKCVNAHDRCFGGAGGPCRECELVTAKTTPTENK